MIRLREIKLPVGHSKSDMKAAVNKRLALGKLLKGRAVAYSITVIRRSLDARRKPELVYVYEVGIVFDNDADERLLKKKLKPDSKLSYEELIDYKPYEHIDRGSDDTDARPVIIGAGPAGLFCAYILATAGLKPIVAERGKCVNERIKDVEDFWRGAPLDLDSNVQFGEGGAGTFSDGKLNTMVKDPHGRIAFVLKTFVKFGAPNDIIYSAKPHIGTDILKQVIPAMRTEIIKLGGEFWFSSKLESIRITNDVLTQITVSKRTYDVKDVVLAIGHSARDTFEMLRDSGIKMEPKPFAVGFRMQHPQSVINMSQYGAYEVSGLGAADYKVTNYKNRTNDPYEDEPKRNVYSFCMCPGGYVVNASSETGRLAVNGMSNRNRDSGNANSAIVIGVFPEDYASCDTKDPLCGMHFQRKLEESAYLLGEGSIPVQRYIDYKKRVCTNEFGDVKPCTMGQWSPADLSGILTEEMRNEFIKAVEGFGHSIQGFNQDDALLFAIESRTSSPVKIVRDDTTYMSNIAGLYPCGEGAGYAGGITSAAVDGIKVAEAIINRRKG